VALWVNDHRYWVRRPGKGEFPTPVTIPARVFRHGTNQLVLRCSNSDEEGRGRAESPPVLVEKGVGRAPPGTLYVLAVGVNDYSVARRLAGQRLPENLLHSASDVRAVGGLWERQKGLLFKDVQVIPLLERNATRDAILKELAALERLVKDRPDDRVVVYLSGHAHARVEGPAGDVAVPGSYCFCTWDFDPRRPEKTGLPAARLQQALARINAHKLVLVDTGRSGGPSPVRADVIRDLTPEDVGPVIISASGPNEEVKESADLLHGVFAQVLVGALGKFGRVDRNGNGEVDLGEYVLYLAREVPRLCGQAKVPLHRPVMSSAPPAELLLPWLKKGE
jgi:hypothetical protein